MAVPLLCLFHVKTTTPFTPFKWWFVAGGAVASAVYDAGARFTHKYCITTRVGMSQWGGTLQLKVAVGARFVAGRLDRSLCGGNILPIACFDRRRFCLL